MGYLVYYIFPTILILALIRKYRESKWGKCINNIQLDGKTVIVTGANSGIGFEIAKELASRKAQVILACRTLKKAKDSCLLIQQKINNVIVVPMELDLSSLESIKSFTNEVKKNFNEIHILINNAGVHHPNTTRVETSDHFEIHFGVNYLGHFYLTNLLLEQLSLPSGKSRVVVIASSLHERGEIHLDDLNSEKNTRRANLYANSKLANIYFAQELANRIKEKNINVYACCPGWVFTGLFRHTIRWYHFFVVAPVAFFFMRSPQQGAQTPIFCATDPELESETGLLYRDCKHYNSKVIFYENISKKLWSETESMINKAIGQTE
ncbi:retinol dehydrogenase 11-like isoform X1 [Diabrotica undecimpunctata]|uniref:retinol dehydrogenase 11-like isoform X1 n=1 Tax=Diabrotica undecimpunctata TaxID=50387 RepID=UPI003B6401A5